MSSRAEGLVVVQAAWASSLIRSPWNRIDFLIVVSTSTTETRMIASPTRRRPGSLSRMLSGRRVTLQLLKAGDVFGDVPLLLGEAEPFDARAVSDATVPSLDVASLFAMLATRPRVAQRWMVSLAERMAGLQQRLVDLLAGDLEAQLASVLLQRADARGDVALSQKQMAELLGVQRTSVQRALKQLEDAQLVKIAYRRVTVLDGPGLLTLFATE